MKEIFQSPIQPSKGSSSQQPPPRPPLPSSSLEPTAPQPSLRLPKVGELFKGAWRLYRERAKVFLAISAISLVPSLIFLGAGTLSREIGGVWAWFFSAILAIILFVIIGFWVQVSLISAVSDKSLGIKEAFKKGWPKLLPFIWVSILSTVIIMGGSVLLIIPGIIFSVWLTFAGFVLIQEGKRGMNALSRSRHLVKEYWWGVFGRLLLLGIVIGVISIVCTAILMFIFGYLLESGVALEIANNVLSTIVGVIVAPFTLAFTFLIYRGLVVIKSQEVFEPKRKTKITLLVVGIIGILLIIAVVAAFLAPFREIIERREDIRLELSLTLIRLEIRSLYAEQDTYKGIDCATTDTLEDFCAKVESYVGMRPVIETSEDDFCLYVKIAEDSYYCGNRLRFIAETNEDPSQSGYCDGITFTCPPPVEYSD